MAELTVDIIARAQQVQQQLRKTIRQVNQLETEFKQAGLGAESLAKGAALAGKAVQVAEGQTRRLNRGLGNFSSVAFQAGQAVSDFAVAGIRGAANNLEFLALQLGASGPLILGITAVTVALVVFSDDIAKAFGRAKRVVKDVEGAIEDLVKIDFGDPSFAKELNLTAELTNEALKEQEQTVKRLAAIVKAQRLAGPAPENFIGRFFRQAISGLSDFEDQLAGAQGLLNDLRKTSEEFAKRERGEVELTGNAILDNALRQQRLNEANEEYQEILEKQLKELERQNRERERARKEAQKLLALAEEQARREAEIALSRSRTGRVQQIGLGLQIPEPGADRIETSGLPRGAPSSSSGFAFRDASGALIIVTDDAIQRFDRLGDSTVRLIELNQELTGVIQSGLGGAFASLATAIGSGENVFDAFRASLGEFAIDVGKTLIAFGTSGIAIRAFVTNPVGAIIAGSALVALGSALKSRVQEQTDSFVTTGRSSAGQRPAFVDPRQGNDGRFRRDPVDRNAFSFPLAPLDFSGLLGNVEFKIKGDDLVGVNEKVSRRRSRTRG